MPFHELVMVDKQKESSSIITNSQSALEVVQDDDDVFEDSEPEEEQTMSSGRRSSLFSSVAGSSFMSKLTDDGSLISAHLQRQESEDEGDLLDLSVMAIAPMKHTPAELTGEDLKYFGATTDDEQSRRRRQRRRHGNDDDDLSVSIMALSPRRSEEESDSEEEEEAREEYSIVSHAFNPRYTRMGGHRQQSKDDHSVSVIAVAEVSDYDSEFELDDDDTDYDEEDYEDLGFGLEDVEFDLSESVMAVACPDADSDDDQSVAFDARGDDMSITTVETELPRESTRGKDRRRRRRRNEVDYDDDEDDDDDETHVIDAEEVSVLTTASNKRHKNHHQQQKRQRPRRATGRPKPLHQNNNHNLLPQYPTDSSEEESYQDRKRRQRRSRRSMTKKSGGSNNRRRRKKKKVDAEAEAELYRRLAEVNRLIEESRREMEELKEAEATKIQAWVRMHQERKHMDSSIEMKHALSRTGTKQMKAAATKIQALVRGVQSRARRSRKRSRRNRKKQKQKAAAEEEAKLRERLEQVEQEMQQCRDALEAQKATQLQALIRGFLQRSKGRLNHERVAAIKIQQMIRPVLRISRLRKKLASIAESKANQLKAIQAKKATAMDEFTPGKYDDMDTRVKMVNFLKKQIEKENEATEKWLTKTKNVKENNVRLVSANSSSICTVERLRIDVKAKEDKHEALVKLNKEWVDGIKEYEHRNQSVQSQIDVQTYQMKLARTCCKDIVELMEARSSNKRLIKEIKFLADHSGVSSESSRLETDS